MAMHKVPTLVLGIGGIGCRIAANISDLLTPEARERVGIVGIDTNINDLSKVAVRGVRTIQTSDDRTVGEYLKRNPQHLPWFPLNAFTASKSLLNGAGQIRAVSRLGALATEEKGGFIAIKEEIQRIRSNRGDSSNGNLTVMVVGSITGGTGAGLFLQIPYYIRKIMRDETGLQNIIIRGMFVGPDLTVDVQPSAINRDAVRVNGYSCIKELNALYMRQLSTQPMSNLKIDFYAPTTETEKRGIIDDIRSAWNELEGNSDYGLEAVSADAQIIAQGNPDIPYDYLYLIEGNNADGGIGTAPLSSVEQLAARMVHTLMFTPVSNNALSVEDNMILQDAAHNGMNRYSSSGMTRLIYPLDLAREYVTLCTIRDLVQNEWMIIDNGFQDQVAEARSRQRTDGQVAIPQMKNAYIDLFRGQVKGEGSLGKLYKEAFTVTPENEEISHSTEYLKKLDGLVSNVLEEDDVVEACEACGVNEVKMNAFTTANSEINRVYDALEKYEKLAKRLATERPAALANQLFPPSWQSMRHHKDASCNIYQLLHNVHPITARFLCYDLIRQLEARIRKLDGKVKGYQLEDYLEDDFDVKDETVKTASQAIRKMQEKNIPILGSLVSEANKIKKIKTKLTDVTDTQRELITTFLRDSLTLATSRMLLERLERLVENYNAFFKNIGIMIEENHSRISKLEDIHLPLGQVGVYCSKDAFRTIAAEYQNVSDDELPADTKTAIFEHLFKVLADDFAHDSKIETERQKAARAVKKAKTLNGIFSAAVVDTIRTEVIKKGSGIVDMNIHEALTRQFELEAPEQDDFAEYLQNLVRMSMKMAAPMVATSSNAAVENTATAYIAMHPDCAATEMGEPNVGATQTLFVPNASPETGNVKVTVLLDDAFSPYEITCFRAKYKFSVEDLTQYSAGSANAVAYRNRMNNLGKNPVYTGNPDDGLTVINPHLDRYWHEEAYLPELYKSERTKNKQDLDKAFIYALGLDLIQVLADENTLDEDGNSRRTWYYQTGRGYAPVKIRNSHIGSSYNDLYAALPYNSRIKKFALSVAKHTMKSRKGYASAEECFDMIMQDDFITDLIQPGTGDKNILDILLEMRSGMDPKAWSALFVGLREVLWEYCAFLFSQNERMVNTAVREILGQMLDSCSIAGKDDSVLTYNEKELKAQVEILQKATYKRN